MKTLADSDSAIGAAGCFLNQTLPEIGHVVEVQVAAAKIAEQVLFHYFAGVAKTVFIFLEAEGRGVSVILVLGIHVIRASMTSTST